VRENHRGAAVAEQTPLQLDAVGGRERDRARVRQVGPRLLLIAAARDEDGGTDGDESDETGPGGDRRAYRSAS
jgi:hypothetical protein